MKCLPCAHHPCSCLRWCWRCVRQPRQRYPRPRRFRPSTNATRRRLRARLERSAIAAAAPSDACRHMHPAARFPVQTRRSSRLQRRRPARHPPVRHSFRSSACRITKRCASPLADARYAIVCSQHRLRRRLPVVNAIRSHQPVRTEQPVAAVAVRGDAWGRATSAVRSRAWSRHHLPRQHRHPPRHHRFPPARSFPVPGTA